MTHRLALVLSIVLTLVMGAGVFAGRDRLFAPEHVANIRVLARGRFWDGTSLYRAQDNFVVQFGDADAEDPARAKPLGGAKQHLPAEFHRTARALPFDPLPDRDGWAAETGFSGGFPAARDASADRAWMTHCYGAVGAGREARRNRVDDFYKRPAGHIDLCNIPVPVRVVP
jgi:cyclophilin family peptidyl-prolyl cis-trans isomerase